MYTSPTKTSLILKPSVAQIAEIMTLSNNNVTFLRSTIIATICVSNKYLHHYYSSCLQPVNQVGQLTHLVSQFGQSGPVGWPIWSIWPSWLAKLVSQDGLEPMKD